MSSVFAAKYSKAISAIAAAMAAFFFIGCSEASALDSSPRMKILGAARAPIGFVAFCTSHPADCAKETPQQGRVILTAATFAQLDQVNRWANTQIQPVTDQEFYGTPEYWTYPTTKGDCEDYVLLKRKLLMDAGWSESSLLITVVRDEKGAGHAVLTVPTDQGDLILDNQREDIVVWSQTPYQYVKRQSQTDPKLWVFVGPVDSNTGVASTR